MKNHDLQRVNQALLLRASIYRMRGNLDRAQEMLAELQPRMGSLPPENILFASLFSEQALLAQARGDTSAALDLINKALSIAEASVKAGNLGVDLIPVLLTHRSDMQRQLGRTDEAVASATQALDRIKELAQPGTFCMFAGHAYLALGRALQAQGKDQEALADYRLATEHLEKSLGPDNAEARAAHELAAPRRA